MFTTDEKIHHVVSKRIPILFQEIVDFVSDVTRIMRDGKLGMTGLGLGIAHF